MARLPRSQRNVAGNNVVSFDQALGALTLSDVRVTTPSTTTENDDDGGAQLTKAEKNAAVHANIIEFFDTNYGKQENRLEGWQLLCQHVGVEEGTSIKGCKKALKKVYINIVDFVRAQQGGPAFTRFGSAGALRVYMLKHRGKIFPLTKAKKSPILRWMLIQVF